MARVIRGRARVLRGARDGSTAERELIAGMAELARERHGMREATGREIGALALEVATRLVGERIEADPALLERIVLRALARARADTAVRVMLHPSDRALVEKRLDLPPEIALVDDEAQSRGGCLVRGTLVSVDARIDTMVAAIAHAMGVDRPT